jgi:N-acyl-D-amino-acid deacylase
VHIDHLKATQQPNWGKVERALGLIERAASEGLDVTFDVYPYTAGSRHLHGSLPGWCQSGGTEAMLARLRDADCRQRLRAELDEWAQGQGAGGGFALDFPRIQITAVKTEGNQWAVGRRLDEIADRRGQDPLDATLDLLIEEEAFVSAVLHAMCEEDVRAALAHPLGCIGSDGIAFAPYGALSRGMPHPRSYGTFPRFLGHYCRDEGLLPLEEGVRKCTSLPASRLGLADRGVVRPGAKADLVVFDPEAMIDRATYEDPHQYPDGIRYVIVNGELVVGEGEESKMGTGRILGHNRTL